MDNYRNHRFHPPVDTIPYTVKELSELSDASQARNSENTVSEARCDGRTTAAQFRQIFLRVGIVTHASGSAFIEMGNTMLVCAVHGPRQKQRMEASEEGKLNCEVTFTHYSSKISVDERKEQELATIVIQSLLPCVRLSAFPKSVLDVQIEVLQDDGSVAAAAVTAAAVAIAAAGVPMNDMVTACSVAKVGSELLLDPNSVEESKQRGGIMISYMSSSGKMTQFYQFGELSHTEISQVYLRFLTLIRVFHLELMVVISL